MLSKPSTSDGYGIEQLGLVHRTCLYMATKLGDLLDEIVFETQLAVSESTQVILFTHEDDVCAWARERLGGEPHKLTELDGLER